MLTLAVLAGAFDWCLWNCDHPTVLEIKGITEDFTDASLYEAVAGRVREGQDYYEAAEAELTARSFPTGSVFNWRMPVYAWIFGKPPSPSWGRAVLVASALLAIASACSAIGPAGGRTMRLAAAAGLAGSYGWLAHPYPSYFMELWSGTFIFISACSIGLGKMGRGVLAGVAALALRELALPYVLTASLLALRRRRARACAALLLATATYLVVFYLHYLHVICRIPPARALRVREWVVTGGTPFALSTCRMNYLLMILPRWCTALYLPLSLLGLIGWEAPAASPIRLTAFAYLLLFGFVGTRFNNYWGWLCMPPLLMGFVWSPIALWDLGSVIAARPGPPAPDPPGGDGPRAAATRS